MDLQKMIPMIYGLKLLKLGSLFVANNISANYMSQVYMEKVLVNQENPQPLINFIGMYSLVDVTFTLFILSITYIIGVFIKKDNTNIISIVGYDLLIGLVSVAILGSIVSVTMQNKKFFMYKDDGLRAIRGLKEIILNFGIVLTLFPIFLSYKST